MNKEVYREPLISRIIYQARHIHFSFLRIKKKIKKIWENRKEYFRPGSRPRPEKKTDVAKSAAGTIKAANGAVGMNYDTDDLSERLAVYTCIFGPYDLIREPLYVGRQCDYYVITDQSVPAESKWKKIEPALPDGFDEWPNAVKNRYFKMHPETIFPTYRYSLYVDGNVRLLTDMYPYVEKLGKKFIGIHKYPLYDCFYENAAFLEKLGLVDAETNAEQIAAYREAGFPAHYGYFECTIILREHNHPQCIRLMDTWWEQYCRWVKRDQQSLMYALWKNGMDKNDVACLGENLRKTERFKINDHREKHKLVVGGPRMKD